MKEGGKGKEKKKKHDVSFSLSSTSALLPYAPPKEEGRGGKREKKRPYPTLISLSGRAGSTWPSGLEAGGKSGGEGGKEAVAGGFGCDYHPPQVAPHPRKRAREERGKKKGRKKRKSSVFYSFHSSY